MSDCFWIVWNPFGEKPPKIQYPSRKAATYAAKAMAKEHASSGDYFFVMKAQSCHQMQVRMMNEDIAAWGVGAPCPYHGVTFA